jgi:hypothetical protein
MKSQLLSLMFVQNNWETLENTAISRQRCLSELDRWASSSRVCCNEFLIAVQKDSYIIMASSSSACCAEFQIGINQDVNGMWWSSTRNNNTLKSQ